MFKLLVSLLTSFKKHNLKKNMLWLAMFNNKLDKILFLNVNLIFLSLIKSVKELSEQFYDNFMYDYIILYNLTKYTYM